MERAATGGVRTGCRCSVSRTGAASQLYPRGRGSRSCLERYRTLRAAFDTRAEPRYHYCVLTECDSEQLAVEAELAQVGQWIGGSLARALVSGSNHTAGARFDQLQGDGADLYQVNPIFRERRQAGQHDIRPKALHR